MQHSWHNEADYFLFSCRDPHSARSSSCQVISNLRVCFKKSKRHKLAQLLVGPGPNIITATPLYDTLQLSDQFCHLLNKREQNLKLYFKTTQVLLRIGSFVEAREHINQLSTEIACEEASECLSQMMQLKQQISPSRTQAHGKTCIYKRSHTAGGDLSVDSIRQWRQKSILLKTRVTTCLQQTATGRLEKAQTKVLLDAA